MQRRILLLEQAVEHAHVHVIQLSVSPVELRGGHHGLRRLTDLRKHGGGAPLERADRALNRHTREVHGDTFPYAVSELRICNDRRPEILWTDLDVHRQRFGLGTRLLCHCRRARQQRP